MPISLFDKITHRTARVLAQSALVIDSCNATGGLTGAALVVRLGAPFPT